MIEEAKRQGYRIQEVEVSLDELPEEGEYFRTNSMGGVRPVAQIGSKKKQCSNEHCLMYERLISFF